MMKVLPPALSQDLSSEKGSAGPIFKASVASSVLEAGLCETKLPGIVSGLSLFLQRFL